MDVKIIPSKLDGEIKEANLLFLEYLNGSNVIGNRVKTTLGKDIVKYLLSYNAKGTAFDLTEKENYIPILALCACFSCSDTKISATDSLLIDQSILAINQMGGFAEKTDYGLLVHGKDNLSGGIVDVSDSRVILSALLIATCSENESVIKNAQKVKEIEQKTFEIFSSLGGNYKVL